MDNQTCAAGRPFGLNGNQLKIIAIISMLLDHVGVELLPQYTFLRILGRLAMPIFAYMIAEGCLYTRNRRSYLLKILVLGLLCQLVFYIATRSVYQGILITFSMSILSVYALDGFLRKRNLLRCFVMILVFSAVIFLTIIAPILFRRSGFVVDYGFPGVLLPVVIYYGRNKREKLILAAAVLVSLGLSLGGIFWCALLALPLLFLYNGHRGKAQMKYLFYVFYPVHLVVIYGISLLL